MKLRLKGNSVRLRLTRSEVMRLRDHGDVEEAADFGGGDVLRYRLQRGATPGPVAAEFRNGTVAVTVSDEAARKWTDSDEVGIYTQSGALTIAIEKDFHGWTFPDDQQSPDACPHPARGGFSAGTPHR